MSSVVDAAISEDPPVPASPEAPPRTLAEDVHRRLKQAIFDFRMPPGQRYSEHELSSVLAVSRTPLRLALHILEHEGYLANVGGRSAWAGRPPGLSLFGGLS